eukprot:CAMPEP_0206615376 /NCGR_PEP_ID=MMETSP0325_2-20121206/58138_1 /ASSEMBLY_ACC=CAM_ASM_000347 /TAXON_ID=2866 /ORGANISM="Crypthecodinium cohnii, Strain Seligo" /LENGTH=162 /DNA_ID=CAMNT_0054136427 /DNA_START=96 /DNA_END=581 /DNA_ORIENTATION=+
MSEVAQRVSTASGSSTWLLNSAFTVVLYGTWEFLAKVATVRGLTASQEALVNKLGFFVGMPLIMAPSSPPSSSTAGVPSPSSPSLISAPKDALLASFLSGFAAAFASLFQSRARVSGDASAVSALCASYPPITLLLCAVFLKEKVTRNKLLGMLFTVIGSSH